MPDPLALLQQIAQASQPANPDPVVYSGNNYPVWSSQMQAWIGDNGEIVPGAPPTYSVRGNQALPDPFGVSHDDPEQNYAPAPTFDPAVPNQVDPNWKPGTGPEWVNGQWMGSAPGTEGVPVWWNYGQDGRLSDALNKTYPGIPGMMYAGGSRWFDEGPGGGLKVPPAFREDWQKQNTQPPPQQFKPTAAPVFTSSGQVGNRMNANGQAAYRSGLPNQVSQQFRGVGGNPYAGNTPPLAPNNAAPVNAPFGMQANQAMKKALGRFAL